MNRGKYYQCCVHNNYPSFRRLSNTNILIYHPHGFGDWVFLSYILPLLEPSNRYFVARYGDHYASLFADSLSATSLYVGHNDTLCGDGGQFFNAHFGLRDGVSSSGDGRLRLPVALQEACERFGIGAVVDLPFVETFGKAPPPFHTKGRYFLKQATRRERREATDLLRPLPSAISFAVPEFILEWMERRLKSYAGWLGRKLCVITRSGYTAIGKNWGHLWREEMPLGKRREGEECRDFIRLMLRHDPEWVFVTMEERLLHGDDTVRSRALRCFSYAELFGSDPGMLLPLGIMLKALLNRADLAVGVPAGPQHLAMAKPGLPVVGIWTQHLPTWYDEPKAESIHLISRNLKEMQIFRRPGSDLNHPVFGFRHRHLKTRVVPGEEVFRAAAELLGFGESRSLRTRRTVESKSMLVSCNHGAVGGALLEEGPISRRKEIASVASKNVGKMIAVTIGVGAKYGFMAELAADACRRRTKLETHILDDEAMRRWNTPFPHCLKFKLFAEFPDAETILYFDADAVFMRDFAAETFAGIQEFVCVREKDQEWLAEEMRLFGVPPEEYFNSGFFIINRTHHEEWLRLSEELFEEFTGRAFEQTPMNAARYRMGMPTRFLGLDYNYTHTAEELELPASVVLAHLFRLADRQPAEIYRRFEYLANRGDNLDPPGQPELFRHANIAAAIEEALQDRTRVYFIQIGSNDGVTGDPLRNLVGRRPDWKGVFVEPVPRLFERLKRNYPSHPGFAFANLAIADATGKKAFFYVSTRAREIGVPPQLFEQIGSFDRNHLLKHDCRLEPYILSEEVDCLSLADLFRRYAVESIDLLHIDAEGADYMILSQLDFQKYAPKVVVYEHEHLAPKAQLAAQRLMRGAGYKIYTLGFDTLCIRP